MFNKIKKIRNIILSGTLFLLMINPSAKPIRFVGMGETLIDWNPARFPDDLLPRVQTMMDSLGLQYANYDTVDVTFSNYEGTIESDSGGLDISMSLGGVNHVGQPPILEFMRDFLKINMACLANNHAYDGGGEGILQAIEEFKKAGIVGAGIGKNMEEIKTPGYLTLNDGTTIALIAGTRNSNDDGPTNPNQPGLWYSLDGPGQKNVFEDTYEDYGEGPMLDLIEEIAPTVDFLVVATHHHWDQWDDNGFIDDDGDDDEGMQQFTQDAIDAGADIFIIDGPHQPICFDVYNDRPILYSNGNVFYNTRKRYPAYDEMSWSSMATDILYDENNVVKAIKVYPLEENDAGILGDPNAQDDGDVDEDTRLHWATRGNPKIATGDRAERIFDHVNNTCSANGFDPIEIDGDVGYWPNKLTFDQVSGGPAMSVSEPGKFRIPIMIDALTLPGGERELVVQFQKPHNFKLDIYDITGKILWTYSSSDNRKMQRIKLPGSLVNGLYIARVSSGTRQQSDRIMLTN